MHNHDTNETFIAMTGRWRCEWNEGKAMQYVDLDPYDVISFPTGVARRFMNVTYDEPGQEHLLMFIIGGNQPQAEFTPARHAALRGVAAEEDERRRRRRSADARLGAGRSARARRLRDCCCSRPPQLDQRYGPADPARYDRPSRRRGRRRTIVGRSKTILDNRCVVCHGCNDAPCQLNLASRAGVTRGANRRPRSTPRACCTAEPTRLFFDAQSNAAMAQPRASIRC